VRIVCPKERSAGAGTQPFEEVPLEVPTSLQLFSNEPERTRSTVISESVTPIPCGNLPTRTRRPQGPSTE